MAEEMQGTVARAGREIGWRSVGSGSPLLLLNGYGGTAADWDPNFIAALAEHFEVVLPDNRGMGTSTWGDDAEPLTIESMAEDVLELADALALRSFSLVGWSMGGFIAQALVAMAPERVTGLGLLGTDAGGPDAVLADPEVWRRLIDSTGTPREQATRLLGVLFPPEVAAELDLQVGPMVAEARAAIDPRVLRAQEDAIDVWHATPLDRAPTGISTLVACGALDEVIPCENAALLAERWATTMPITYEGCGHAVMAQVPIDLAAHLTAHLSAQLP